MLFNIGLRRLKARRHVGGKAPGGLLAGAQHLFCDNAAIDAPRQRLTHPRIRRRALLRIKGVVVGAELVRRVDLTRQRFFQLGIHVLRKGFGDIDIARAIALSGAGLFIDGNKGHFGQDRMRVVPVVWVTRQHNLLIHHARRQLVSAVAHQLARRGPAVTLAVDNLLRYREKRDVSRKRGKPGHRAVKRHLQVLGVYGADAESIRRHLAFGYRARVADARQSGKPGKGRTVFGLDKALPAVDEILRRHRLAVRPFCIAAQRKDPGFIVAAAPAFGYARHDIALRILIRQPLEQIADHLNFRQPNGFQRIERGGFIFDMADNLLPIGQLRVGRQLCRQRLARDACERQRHQRLAKCAFHLHSLTLMKRCAMHQRAQHDPGTVAQMTEG